jgi:hypothetical protein
MLRMKITFKECNLKWLFISQPTPPGPLILYSVKYVLDIDEQSSYFSGAITATSIIEYLSFLSFLYTSGEPQYQGDPVAAPKQPHCYHSRTQVRSYWRLRLHGTFLQTGSLITLFYFSLGDAAIHSNFIILKIRAITLN